MKWRRQKDTRTRIAEVEHGGGPFAFSASVDVECSPDRLWDFIWDPQSQLLLDDQVLSAVTMPGPIRASGEVQAYLRRTSTGLEGSFVEVVEYGPGRRAVYRSVGDLPPEIGTDLIEAYVEQTEGGGGRLTHVAHMTAGEGYAFPTSLVRELHVAHVSQFAVIHERLRAILEA